MLSNFWIGVVVIVVIGHFIWFVYYAIKTLKDDEKDEIQQGVENNMDNQ